MSHDGIHQPLTTLYHTIPTYNNPFENIVGKGENTGCQHFSPFPTIPSTQTKSIFNI